MMERQEMTENAALVLTEWIHTLAGALRRPPEPPFLQQIAQAAARCCPEAAEAASAAGAVERLLPERPMRSGREAVRRLEQALPENLSENRKRGCFALLLMGLGGGVQGLDRAGGAELRERLGALLEDRAERILAYMAELASSGAAGLEPAAPEPLEGIPESQRLSLLATAVFCTAAEGLLGGTWQWPAAVGISLAAGGWLVSQCAPEDGGFPQLLRVQERLYGAALLIPTALCLQVFATSGRELEKMEELLLLPEDCPEVLAQQLYGLLGHAGGYYTRQAGVALEELSGALRAYGAYRDGGEALPVRQPAPAADAAVRLEGEMEQENARAENR